MYFPSDINFQYFFFDTYPGYFLQALPIALIFGAIYAVCQVKRNGQTIGRAIFASLFICYVTGLLCLTLFEYIMGEIYYDLLYHMPSGRNYTWFTLEYNLIPDFFHHFGSENMGNILMYLPFGVLYPLFKKNCSWKQTITVGIAVSLGIELLQPIFGRSFDINDIILNGFGVILSTVLFYALRMVFLHKK